MGAGVAFQWNQINECSFEETAHRLCASFAQPSPKPVHMVALASEPEERFVRKLSRALSALLTSPEVKILPDGGRRRTAQQAPSPSKRHRPSARRGGGSMALLFPVDYLRIAEGYRLYSGRAV